MAHNPLHTNNVKHDLQTLSGGNPRLLEQLDALFSQPLSDDEKLLTRLENTQEEFREALVLEELFLCLPQQQRRLLAASSVYHLPVPATAIIALSDDSMATTFPAAISLGLVEATLIKGQPYECCSPLLRPIVQPELTAKQWLRAQQCALEHGYSEWFEQQKELSEPYLKELFRLAKACQDQQRLCVITDTLTFAMIKQYRHYEVVQLCDEALLLTNDWRVHHQAAEAKLHLGLEGVAEHYRQATNLAKENLGLEFDERALTVLWDYSQYLSKSGELDEAFDLLAQTLQPAFESKKAHREVAVMRGMMADILKARGELDEALRIRREDQLPVYERLGDVRSLAVAQGKIADILMDRGELDEALRILREDEIPVYEHLGEVRSLAATQGKIADILMVRGELEEALRIRREDELPVYERLGDVRSRLVSLVKISQILHQINAEINKEEIQELMLRALNDAQKMQIPEAKIIIKMMADMNLNSELIL